MAVRKRKTRPDGFVIYSQGVRVLQLLSDEAAGKAIKGAITYFLTQEEMEENDSAEYLAFSVLKIDVDNCLDRFREMCQRNAENKNKGNESSQVVTSGDENREELKSESEKRKTDLDMSGGGEDTGHQDTPAPQKKNVSFFPPSLNEVQQLCKEKGYVTSPTKFFNYYEGNGWKGVADWRAKLAAWSEDDAKKQVSDKMDNKEVADYAPNAAELERMRKLRERLKGGTL